MDVLIYGDTERSPALRHEVPLAIGDPFLYLESDGRRAVVTNALEDERIGEVAPELERLLIETLGVDELVAAGLPYAAVREEVAHTPIVIDLWPRDERSGSWADMTRTFVRGEIGDRVAQLHATVLKAHERSCGAARPGVTGEELYNVACSIFETAGHPTLRTKPPGKTLREGFFYDLGHGLGLEVHEEPALGRSGRAPLIAGDVVAVEPGVVVPGVGGVRVEDDLIVTDAGNENLTAGVSYSLTP